MEAVKKLANFDLWFFLFAGYLIVKGLVNKDNSFLTAESGLGYTLGIVGGSMMLVVLLYPLRKHSRLLRSLGPIKYWFRMHMLLGVGGPVLILFHSNFSLGSTNSNIALICMLLVAGSGLFGRVFYKNIHHGLYGRKIRLNDLREHLEQLKETFGASERIHEILVSAEKRHLRHRWLFFAVLNMLMMRFTLAVRGLQIRWHISKKGGAELSSDDQKQIASYIREIMRVHDFMIYERLFALWHVLHIPLYVMMLISGIVHVFVVHIY